VAAGAREGAAAHGSGGGLIALLAHAGAPRWRYLHGEVGVAVGWVGWETEPHHNRISRIPWHFRAAWLRLKQTDLISGKGQFR
jgi:hypothetical protein